MLEVFTTGGGEYLVNMFNAVSAWSGAGGYRAMLRVIMVMGLIYSLLVLAFSMDWRAWFNWFLQATLIYLCLMVPTVTIKVTDRVNPGLAPATIANVPLGLGVIASFTSQAADYLTRTAETVFVMPAALAYSSGGIVYGARLWDKVTTFEVKDPVFRGNLDAYMKQCLYYDILLGQQDIKALSESQQLWTDIGTTAAINRGLPFVVRNGTILDTEARTCRQAWADLDQQWNAYLTSEVPRFARSFYPDLTQAAAGAKIAADVPVVSNLFHGVGGSANEILRQNALVDIIANAQLNFGDDDADAFALMRADTQARNSMSTLAQQAMTWVPVLNIVLIMIFFGMFPVVFPLFLFPGTGVPTLKGYLGGFFYLAAWGPIYVLLHMFLMDRIASQMAATAPGGITLAGWGGIQAVNQDSATMAGMLMMSVPLLAGVLARGAGAVAGSAGSMFSLLQSSSEAAGTERATGDYAYGNVQMANASFNNRQQDQWQLAGAFVGGASAFNVRDGHGILRSDYGDGHTVIKARDALSEFPWTASLNRGFSSDLRAQGQSYLSEADRIENGEAQSFVSSHGRFASAVVADSTASGTRWERGHRSDVTSATGNQVAVRGVSSQGTETTTYDGYTQQEGNRTFDGRRQDNADQAGVRGNLGLGASLPVGGGGAAKAIGSKAAGASNAGERGSGSVGLPGAGLNGSIDVSGSRTNTDTGYGGYEHTRGMENVLQHGETKRDGTTGSVEVSGSSGVTSHDGTFRSSSRYGDASHTSSQSSGTDWREATSDERRFAANEYREIGRRLMREASYTESEGVQIGSNMSNLIAERYAALNRAHPEMMLPDLADPWLDRSQMERRDAGIQMAVSDLLGDLRDRRIDQLGDVAGIGPMVPAGGLGKPGDGVIGPVGSLPGGAPAVTGTGPDQGPYELIPVHPGDGHLPIPGHVGSGLGMRTNPISGNRREHEGVDIPARIGTPIVAQAGGVLLRSGYQEDGAGNYVVIDHGNGIETKYFHMQSPSALQQGTPIEEGTVIGEVGSTGASTGPHLHYEIRKDGELVDPQRYRIGRGRS